MPAHVIECVAACTVTVQHEISLPLLSLTTEEASLIAVAVSAVWAVGFGIRMLIQTLKSSDSSSTESES